MLCETKPVYTGLLQEALEISCFRGGLSADVS
jgi:hypothetical protein